MITRVSITPTSGRLIVFSATQLLDNQAIKSVNGQPHTALQKEPFLKSYYCQPRLTIRPDYHRAIYTLLVGALAVSDGQRAGR